MTVKHQNDKLTQKRSTYQRFHSIPVAQAHQPYHQPLNRVPMLKPETTKCKNYNVTQKAKLGSTLTTVPQAYPKRQPNWSTVAVIGGNPGKVAEDDDEDEDDDDELY